MPSHAPPPATLSLPGATALVTGGAGGIGLGIGQALAEAGVQVVLADIDDVQLEVAGTTIPGARTRHLDVTDREQWAAVAVEVPDVDILVNNAGMAPDLFPLAEMPAANWDRIVALNLTSVFNGVSAYAGRLCEKGRGHIVNVASMAGLVATPRLGGYVASKFGVVGLSEVLRGELAPAGVGVSVVCPGMVTSRLAETTARQGLERAAITAAGPARPGANSMDPIWVGRRVVEAIRGNDLYVITHPNRKASVEARVLPLLAAFDTEMAQPGYVESAGGA